MAENLVMLIMEARGKLRLDNQGLARLLGVSLRTVERHSRQGGVSSPDALHKLVRALHPVDPALAARLAEAGGANLVMLGLLPASPDERAAARPPGLATPEEMITVVQAAATALGLPLDAARQGVAAAFEAAHALGLSVQALQPMLSPRKRSSPAEQ
jgi:hypothetical protein